MYRVYECIDGVTTRIGRGYTTMEKAVRFAMRLTNPQVEVRKGNQLEALKIKGEMRVLREIVSCAP